MIRRILFAALLLWAPAWSQYDMHETFEGSGAGCAAVETWSSGPTTISTDSSLTGSCNLLNPTGTLLFSSATASGCAEFQFRKDDNTTSNTNFFQFNAGASVRFRVNFTTTGNVTLLNPGGSSVTCRASAADDTTYLIEACFEKGTGADAKVKCRSNGGTFTESTNGTTTEDMDTLILNDPPTSNERLDEIKICGGTYTGVSECDPPPVAPPALSEAGSFTGFWPSVFEVQAQSLPDGEEQEAYTETQFVALNGNPPHTWTVSAGALPDGLSLSSSGALTGTPEMGEAGTHNFTVEATDDDGGLALRDFSLVVQALPGDLQEPWERDFTTLRTHYVAASGGCTSGGTCGEIGNPETLAHALSHDQAGDLHILRGGTYTGSQTFPADGTATNPIIWKCFVDPATGDPENCNVMDPWALTGDWNWLWNMNSTDATSTSGDAAFSLEARGTALINSRIVRWRRGNGLDNFNFGPDIVVYGSTLMDNGAENTTNAPRHNTYTANNFNTNGWKYFAQLISLDQPNCTECPNPPGPNLFHNNFSANAAGNGTGYHVQDSTFNNGRVVIVQHTSFTTGNPPISRWRWHRNWYDTGLANAYLRIGNHVPAQMQITDSLFRNTRFEDYRYWGALDDCFDYFAGEHSIFTGNKIWSPIGGKYMKLATWNYNGLCDRNNLGAAKFRDVDEWDNNTYGPSGAGNNFDINANGSNLTGRTLPQWRTDTDAARETAGGTAFDASSTETALPTTDQVECFDNFYEPGWGYCRAINWDGNGSVTIPGTEVDKIVGNGKNYKVRNPRDFYGTPLESGTYTAGAGIASITLPEDAVNDVLLVWITSQP